MRCILDLMEKFANAKVALNIKADGLCESIEQEILQDTALSNRCFAFDMSVPDTFSYKGSKVPYFVRASELEDYRKLIDGSWYMD